MKELIIVIIGTVIGGLILFLITKNWDNIKNFFFKSIFKKKSKEPSEEPLDINVGSKNLKIIELHGDIPLEVYMPIGFTNRTSSKFDVTFSNFDFNSEKNIDGIIFGIKKRIFEEPNLRRRPKTNLSLDLGNESHYLCIKINLLKKYKRKEFFEYIKEYENTSMILKFDYSIAINFKNKTFKKKIKGFFSGLIKSTKEFGSG